MAFLIPLLMPTIIEAGTNIGIGISNAIQGDTSSVSFQIGGKVFSSRKSFNLASLPPELRVRILLEALQESVAYIQPAPFLVDPLSARLYEIQRQVPLQPDHANYRSIYGDRISANGFPISSWRWQGVCSEWREELKGGLWKNLEIVGFRPWANLLAMIEKGRGAELLRLAKTVTIREGFERASDLYDILSCPSLDNLESISILPDYPTPYHPLVPSIPAFNFGFQLIRTQRSRLKSLVYGMPLESTTNEASRQQLSILRPSRLTLSFVRPTIPLFKELATLVGETTDDLTIRYIPTGSGKLVAANILLCEPLQSFKRVSIFLYLPKSRVAVPGPFGSTSYIPQKDQPAISEFIASLISALEVESEEVQERYEVWRMDGWEIPGAAQLAAKTRLWPEDSEVEATGGGLALGGIEKGDGTLAPAGSQSGAPGGSQGGKGSGILKREAPKERQHWDRETNLKLLGGLVNLRLESKKH